MKKLTAKTARKLVLRAEAITILTSTQLTAAAGGQARANDSGESEFNGCTTQSTHQPQG